MRYRPFGRTGVSVSAVALTVDDRAGQRGGEALSELIFAAMEAGVNSFHLECDAPEVLQAVGRSLATVERRLLFVSMGVGAGAGEPDAVTGAVDRALAHTGLERLDLALLDAPDEAAAFAPAMAALRRERARGRIGLIGLAGAGEAVDALPDGRDAEVLAAPLHPRSGWTELNRLKLAAHKNMGVIAYDYFPELLRRPATTPGVPRKRGLFGVIAGEPAPHPLAGAGTFAFLHYTRAWTPEALCLACALMEPSVSTVLVRAHDPERLAMLAAVPDRDLPPGLAAKVEMARFGVAQAPDPPGEGQEAAAAAQPSERTGRSRSGEGLLERLRRGTPASITSLWVRTKTAPAAAAPGAASGEAQADPPADTTAPPAASPAPPPEPVAPPSLEPRPAPSLQPGSAPPRAAIWRSKDYDYPVEPTGETFPGPDGRMYLKVNFDGSQTFVPEDEIIFPEAAMAAPPPPAPAPDAPEPRPALDAPEAPPLQAANGAVAAMRRSLSRQ